MGPAAIKHVNIMLYLIVFLGLFFLGLGYILNESNAKYLLSGYNTMSEEERKSFDIKAYVPYFRRFHLFLGLSFLIIGLLLYEYGEELATGLFVGIYPLLAYTVFMIYGQRFSSGSSRTLARVGIAVMMATMLLVGGLLYYGAQKSELEIGAETLSISGMYGESWHKADLDQLRLVEELPKIVMRSNGYALGEIRKGHFKLENGESVKLILDSRQGPFILIETEGGDKIYYSRDEESNRRLYAELRQSWPEVVR